MTTPIESSPRAEWWRSALTARLALAGTFVAILLAVIDAGIGWSGVAASFAGFLTALTVIAAVATSWEHLVANACSDGLVESEAESRTFF